MAPEASTNQDSEKLNLAKVSKTQKLLNDIKTFLANEYKMDDKKITKEEAKILRDDLDILEKVPTALRDLSDDCAQQLIDDLGIPGLTKEDIKDMASPDRQKLVKEAMKRREKGKPTIAEERTKNEENEQKKMNEKLSGEKAKKMEKVIKEYLNKQTFGSEDVFGEKEFKNLSPAQKYWMKEMKGNSIVRLNELSVTPEGDKFVFNFAFNQFGSNSEYNRHQKIEFSSNNFDEKVFKDGLKVAAKNAVDAMMKSEKERDPKSKLVMEEERFQKDAEKTKAEAEAKVVADKAKAEAEKLAADKAVAEKAKATADGKIKTEKTANEKGDDSEEKDEDDKNDAPTNEYTIIKGDTLWAIAKNSEGAFTSQQLIDANAGINPKKLKIGQKINLPSATKGSTEKKTNKTRVVDNKEKPLKEARLAEIKKLQEIAKKGTDIQSEVFVSGQNFYKGGEENPQFAQIVSKDGKNLIVWGEVNNNSRSITMLDIQGNIIAMANIKSDNTILDIKGVPSIKDISFKPDLSKIIIEEKK